MTREDARGVTIRISDELYAWCQAHGGNTKAIRDALRRAMEEANGIAPPMLELPAPMEASK